MTQRAWAMLKEANIDALIAADDLTGAAKSLRGSVTLV